MAFEREDTDKVYDKLICPALRRNHITPVRIDRMAHTDDIDDRIIRELQICDFVIADLTYARPSVYFEAGYAQRAVPVIYACRKDHLSKKTDDSLRVHFDLQMKPIVVWKDYSDRTFVTRLEKRIRFVTGPLKRRKKRSQVARKDADEFGLLPIRERTQRVLDVCVSRLRRAGYSELSKKIELPLNYRFRGIEFRFWIGRRLHKGKLKIAVVFVNPSLKKKVLADFRQALGWLRYEENMNIKKIKEQMVDMFLCTLTRIPRSRISTYLPDYHIDTTGKKFTRTCDRTIGHIYDNRVKSKSIQSQSNIYVLDSIKSNKIFAKTFSQKIRGLDK